MRRAIGFIRTSLKYVNLFWTPSILRSMERLEVSHEGSYILLVIFLCE